MLICPECGWPMNGKNALADHREIKHGVQRFEHDPYAVWSSRIDCPECNSTSIEKMADEFVDGGGSHTGPALGCWCKDCGYEWMEVPDFD